MNNISKLQKVQELLQARFLLLAGIILSVASYRLLIYFNEYFLLLSLITILLADLVVIRNKNIDNANRTKYFRMSFIHWPISGLLIIFSVMIFIDKNLFYSLSFIFNFMKILFIVSAVLTSIKKIIVLSRSINLNAKDSSLTG